MPPCLRIPGSRWRACFLALALWTLAPGLSADAPLRVGANVNQNLEHLRPDLLDRSRTTWIRGFLPVLEFLDGPRRLETDAGVAAWTAAVRGGRRAVISLKWDFEKQGARVPAPGSAPEQACFAWVEGLLRAHARDMDLLVLANEPFVDTPREDLVPGKDGRVPLVVFLERLLARVHAGAFKARDGAPLPLYLGAFTRLDRPANQGGTAVRALLELGARDPRVAGLDLHLHQQDPAQMDQALAWVRKATAKPLIVTEFSLVWRTKAHLEDALGATLEGRRFAETHHRDPRQTVLAYVNAALAQPVGEAEWNAFLASQPWFLPTFLRDAYARMARAGVTLATYGLTQGPRRSPPGRLSADTNPWLLNFLYVPRTALGAQEGEVPVNAALFQDYVGMQK